MGQQVSRVFRSSVKRPMQRYNVEHRAAAALAKIEDPNSPAVRAPMYESDKIQLENLRQSNPELAETEARRDDDLHKRLRDVYVKSEDPVEFAKPEADPNRPLPEDRTQYAENFVPGMMRRDKRKAARGKVTLDDAVKFLTDHSIKPDVHTADHIADTYRLNPEKTANALKYFKVYKVHIPEDEVEKERLHGPQQLGKDWIEGRIEDRKTMMEYQLEREEKRKNLEQKKKERDDQKFLGGS